MFIRLLFFSLVQDLDGGLAVGDGGVDCADDFLAGIQVVEGGVVAGRVYAVCKYYYYNFPVGVNPEACSCEASVAISERINSGFTE